MIHHSLIPLSTLAHVDAERDARRRAAVPASVRWTRGPAPATCHPRRAARAVLVRWSWLA